MTDDPMVLVVLLFLAGLAIGLGAGRRLGRAEVLNKLRDMIDGEDE